MDAAGGGTPPHSSSSSSLSRSNASRLRLGNRCGGPCIARFFAINVDRKPTSARQRANRPVLSALVHCLRMSTMHRSSHILRSYYCHNMCAQMLYPNIAARKQLQIYLQLTSSAERATFRYLFNFLSFFGIVQTMIQQTLTCPHHSHSLLALSLLSSSPPVHCLSFLLGACSSSDPRSRAFR
jgi:hypothetical protein